MFRNRLLSMFLLMGMLISQSVPRALAQTNCDHAQFVTDVSTPDGSSFAPGAAFTKTWRLMNIGTCTWTAAYNVIWDGGELMDTPLSFKLPAEVPPGGTVDVSVNLKAPRTPANYKAFFKLTNAAGTEFGIGDSANLAFWVDINVVIVNAVIYDFVANASFAQWRSGAGILPFPGTSGDNRGFAYQVDQPHLEDDSLDTAPGLLVVPQNKFNGYIQATYPEFEVQQGDRLQTLVNCEFGATRCYVTFRIDYLLPNGAQRTLWSWKEAYDRRFYRADLDLSSLAGQRVRFVFMLLSTGFATGDRGLWGSPRIIRTSGSQPPAPPPTLTPLPPPPPTATPVNQPPPTIVPSGCDRAAFVIDATVPDGTVFSPGAAFTKTWRLRNAGTCTWTTSYRLVYYSGDAMGASTAVNLPWTTAPGQTVDVSVNMVAPATAGQYRGYWILSNANGQFFGIGANATDPIWVQINIAGEAPVGTGYDFTANVCSAEWRSTVGVLPCPGTDGSSSGFILRQDAPKLEDGSTGTPGLLAAPQNRWNGYIQGFYPTFTVQPGDRFQTTVGCEFGAACYLTFRLDYQTASGFVGTFWQWREQNEGKVYNADIDLTPLAGRSVRFILTVLAAGTAANDRALWGSPRIARAGGAPPPATITPAPPTATSTTMPPTPTPPDDWLTYTNTSFGFQFKYPPQGQISEEDFNALRMDLPFAPGTNLREKYLELRAVEGANPCRGTSAGRSQVDSSETVVINGITFLKETGGDAGAGNIREWVAYSTLKGNICISMDFILHSLNAGNFPTPPPVYDKAAESVVFTQMMSTFGWTAQPGDWSTYTNAAYGFEIKYPPQSDRFFETPSSILIRLPIQPGTNLGEKYVQVSARVANPCQSPLISRPGSPTETVVINGISFFKQIGDDAGAGNLHEWVSYSTLKNNDCISMDFVLRSLDPGNFATPIPVFDKAAESAVFAEMMASFRWTTPVAPTPTPSPTASAILPDLTIVQLNIEQQNTSCLMPGDPMGVRARIQNNGQAAAGSFVVRVDGAEQTVSGLGIGETTIVFFSGYTNPTTAMVDATNLIAESDETNNSRSEMVPIATPPLPCETPTVPAATLTPTPAAALGPYAVVRVPFGYVLNIHSAAGNNQPIIGSLQADAVNVMRTGPTASVENATWWEIQNPGGGTGWVLAYHLSEYVSHDAFCADTRLPILIEQLKGSMNQSNGDMFAGLVSPAHGADVNLWAYGPAIHYDTNTARTVFTSAESHNWGGGPRGEPDIGTFVQIIQPKMLEVVNAPNMETYCDNLTKVYPLATPWPHTNIRYYNLYKPATPGNDFDFRTWLIGFEYINNQPYLYAMVSIVWEP